MIRYRDTWSAGFGRFIPESIPEPLQERVLEDGVPARMITDVGGETVMVFGIPLPEVGAYFEFFSLSEDDRTLSNVALSLLLASVITTALGVLLGVFAARRAVRPVADAAQAAKAIAGGHLGTRLPPTDDPDLGVLASSFNDMASALQLRIERDARFASDVSHELRSPLMTLSASVEVMEARRNELPGTGPGRPRPADERRQPVPGSRRGPPGDQPLRRRRHPPPPRGPPGRPVRAPRRRRQLPRRKPP